ncbi:MAG TPA: glycosyltransferase [Solirubrobacteraceae bacterium]
MRVSVLIGAYDNADTLPRAIDSILGQTLGGLELIVVDDGSTDGTAELVDGLDDPRVRRLSLPHMGISRSLNAGLAEARAPYVAIQDADDWSYPNRLERQVALLDSRPDVAVVGCRMREVGPDGETLAPRTSFAAGDVAHALLRFNPIPNTSSCFRRAEILALGGYDPRLRYAMEYDLWLRAAEHHTVYALDEELAVRSMSGLNVAARKERAQVAETARILAGAAWRRRTVAGLPWIALPALSWATPLPLKRAVRRRRGQAP